MEKHGIEHKYKEKIIRVLSALFPQVRIILFGSRARGTHSERSDIDIALAAGNAISRFDVEEAREMLSVSDVPYTIELVDLHSINKNMQDSIMKEGITWTL